MQKIYLIKCPQKAPAITIGYKLEDNSKKNLSILVCFHHMSARWRLLRLLDGVSKFQTWDWLVIHEGSFFTFAKLDLQSTDQHWFDRWVP